MAKQVGSGVVAAAKSVSDIQGRFQDVGGQFMTGYNKSLETKKAKEAESEAALARVNKLMDGFTNDIDIIKFKPEDQTVVKNKITQWRNEYATAANAAAKIKDKSSSEYQQYIDTMNGVQSKMVNLKNNIDGLAAFKGEYADNVKAGAYSIAGQNAMSLAQGETMVTSPIGSITDNGDLQWNAGVGSVREGFSFQDYSKPFAKANNVALELDKIATPLTTMKTPLTKFDKDYINERVNNLVGNDPNVLASIIADGELKSFNFTDIDLNDPNAKDIVVDRLVQAMYDARGSRVQQDATANSNNNDRSRYKMPETIQEMIKVQEDARAEGLNIGVMEPADVISKEAKIFSLGPSDNPEQIRVKMDPSTKKWIYYNAKLGSKAEYGNLLELMNSHPKVFYNS